MTDQALAAVESEAAPIPETGEVEAVEVESQVPEQATEAEGEEQELKYVEIEIDGRVYEVPEEIKDGYLRQADYTKKTQEVSESRKAFESERETFARQQAEAQQQVALYQQNLQNYANLASLDAQLQQFQQVDWNRVMDDDPVEAQKLQWQFNQLKEQRQQVAAHISQAEQVSAQQRQQSLQQLIEQGRETLAKEIPNWSSDTAKQLNEYGKEQGFRADELAQVYDPRAVKVLHKAYLYDQMMKKAQEKPPTETAQPTRKVSGGRTVTKDPEKMSMEEWVKWREKQLNR